MKYGKLLVALTFLTNFANAGVERGGGTPPPPFVIPEKNVTVQCDITLTQLGNKIQRAFTSHSHQTFTWLKNQHAYAIVLDLKEINNWVHSESVAGGPLGTWEEEVKEVPKDAIFEGKLVLKLTPNSVSAEAKVYGFPIGGNSLSASSSNSQEIDQAASWITRANYVVTSPQGTTVDQHNLFVGCSIDQK